MSECLCSYSSLYVVLVRISVSLKHSLLRVGVSYYDCSVRQLHVLEFWEEDCSDFTLINMGITFQLQTELISLHVESCHSLLSVPYSK